MKRTLTAFVLIALMIFVGISGENKTRDTTGMLKAQAQSLYESFENNGYSAETAYNKAKNMYEEWKKELGTLTLYMNNENLRPVTAALREVKDAAASGDTERLDSALKNLSYAVDDLSSSENLNAENVF